MRLSRMWCLFLAMPLVAGQPAPPSQSRSVHIYADASSTRMEIVHDDVDLHLVVFNPETRDVPVTVAIDILTPRPTNTVARSASRDWILKPGKNSVEFHLDGFFREPNKKAAKEAFFSYQVQYRFRPQVSLGAEVSVFSNSRDERIEPGTGVIKVSEILDYTFVLRVGRPGDSADRGRLSIPVFTLADGTGEAVKGIDIHGTLTIVSHKIGVEDRVLTVRKQTGSLGSAILDFKLPQTAADDDLRLAVEARRGREIWTVKDEINRIAASVRVHLMTDKPIYQPGQRLEMRMLAFMANRPLAENAFRITVREPDGRVAVLGDLKTSRYGEAHTEWAIPSSAVPGRYSIGVEDDKGNKLGTAAVDVRSYELPNFTVRTRADRPFYLSGQKAVVEIQASYLFGQPVSGARVKVQATPALALPFSSPPGLEPFVSKTIEGVADSTGKFTALVELWRPLESTRPAGTVVRGRFQDWDYTAYVTDPLSGRTEERRFSLRSSREAIHIHIAMPQRMSGEPGVYYVLTQYADGSPAACSVELRTASLKQYPDQDLDEPASTGAPLAVVQTNRFGVARIEMAGIDRQWTSAFDDVYLVADDKKGSRGWETFGGYTPADIVLETDKALYAAGDALHVRLRSIHQTGPVVVDLLRIRNSQGALDSDDETFERLETRIVQLEQGATSVVFPYSERFEDDLLIAAHYVPRVHAYPKRAQVVVFYLGQPALELQVIPEKTTYRPGEEARISFRTRNPGGVRGPNLLGIAVRDSAVDQVDARPSTSQSVLSASSLDAFDVLSEELRRAGRTRPLPEDLMVAAAYLTTVRAARTYYDGREWSDEGGKIDSPIDRNEDPRFVALETALKNGIPTTIKEIRELLVETVADRLLDPWLQPYYLDAEQEGSYVSWTLWSAGPDRKAHTADDLLAFDSSQFYSFDQGVSWGYGAYLDRAIREYQERTGEYVRDRTALREAVRSIGQDIDTWKNFWGDPFQFTFGVERTAFTIAVAPARMESRADRYEQGVLWQSRTDYAGVLGPRIERAIGGLGGKSGVSLAQIEEMLRAELSGTDRTDVWGKPYYLSVVDGERYRIDSNPPYRSVAQHLDVPYGVFLDSKSLTEIPPATAVQRIAIRSRGPDGLEKTADDFDIDVVHRFEATAYVAAPQPLPDTASKSAGTIRGVIKRFNSRTVFDVRVTLFDAMGNARSMVTSENGVYAFDELPPGSYRLLVEAPNYLYRATIREIPLTLGVTVSLDVSVQARSVEDFQILRRNLSLDESLVLDEASTVGLPLPGNDPLTLIATLPGYRADRGDPAEVPAQATGRKMEGSQRPAAPLGVLAPAYTPRLREYFPETLVWNPALETDRNGNAELRFKLADNITAWKIEAIASTLDGRIARANAEIFAYQPFFMEHDPPRILTEGDRIDLPVTLRSYLDSDQSVKVAMKPQSWLEQTGGSEQTLDIKAGATIKTTFGFKATAPVWDGVQRVTATGGLTGDDISKPVTVHPNGWEAVATESRLVNGSAAFDVQVPKQAVPGSAHAEVRIYPDLASHIAAAIEAILERPHGCAEQVISSAYPSLQYLRFEQQSGRRSGPQTAKAREYLEEGYSRLRKYQTKNGGFTYWGSGEPDVAVTAYAVQFMNEAGEFIAINDSVLNRAVAWLVSAQRPDGSWSPDGRDGENTAIVLDWTALVVQALSTPEVTARLKRPSQVGAPRRDVVGDALRFVRAHREQATGAYAAALVALTALQRSDRETAAWALERLETLAHAEGDAFYWDPTSGTPFHGWALPGAIEASSLSIRALGWGAREGIQTGRTQALVDGGLLYLLRHKDRYGVWFSTQATVRALDVLSRFAAATAGQPRAEMRIEVRVDGKRVQSYALPRRAAADPIRLDISSYLATGNAHVEVSSSNGVATAEVIETHYMPWTLFEQAPEAESLGFRASFDKTEGQTGDTFTGTVHAERKRMFGMGMIIAEIGLPPGAEVDREFLDEVVRSSNVLYRYEIGPDRIVAYLWPRSSGVDFQFKFHARYGIDAQTAPSVLYDYNNPAALFVQPPTHFVVK